jgi:hypothetical protein
MMMQPYLIMIVSNKSVFNSFWLERVHCIKIEWMFSKIIVLNWMKLSLLMMTDVCSKSFLSYLFYRLITLTEKKTNPPTHDAGFFSRNR